MYNVRFVLTKFHASWLITDPCIFGRCGFEGGFVVVKGRAANRTLNWDASERFESKALTRRMLESFATYLQQKLFSDYG